MSDARMVTVYEIAQRVGVSATTVSRALNRSGLVRPELQRRIEQVAESMGYAPDLIARGLRARQMRWLGLVVDTIDQPWAAQISGAISSAASAAGWSVVLMPSDGKAGAERETLNRLISLRVGAVIRIESPIGSPIETLPARHRMIVVAFGSPRNRPNRVGSDEEGSAYTATRHLAALGHRRIGHLAGRPGWPGTDEQIAGFRRAMVDSAWASDVDLVARGDWFLESGYRLAHQFLDAGATALFAATDSMAAGAIDAARERGRRVPEDVAVVGHDDSVVCEIVRPRLTSMALPLREMGHAAARLALTCIEEDRTSIPSVTVGARLVVRESCGAAGGEKTLQEKQR